MCISFLLQLILVQFKQCKLTENFLLKSKKYHSKMTVHLNINRHKIMIQFDIHLVQELPLRHIQTIS